MISCLCFLTIYHLFRKTPHLRLGGEEQQWLPHGGDTGAVLHGVALHAGAGEAAHRVLADLAARPKYLTLINIQAATLVCSYLVPRLTVAGGAGGGVDAPVGAGGGGAGGSRGAERSLVTPSPIHTLRHIVPPFPYSPGQAEDDQYPMCARPAISCTLLPATHFDPEKDKTLNNYL